MVELIKNYKIWLVFITLIAAFSVILFHGLNLGIDFKGGTLFQIHLIEPVSADQMARITQIIEQRLNWTGLKDIKVYSWGNEFIVVQLSETDPKEVQRIESLLKKQGKFEVMLEGKLAFAGEEIIQVDTAQGIAAIQPTAEGIVTWNLPFTLKGAAAKNFRDLSFHKCQLISLGQGQGKSEYDCALTYFFIDRPTKAIIVSTKEIDSKDNELFKLGNYIEGIPSNTNFEEVKLNASIPYFIVDNSSTSFDENDLNQLKELVKDKKFAIIPSNLNQKLKEELKAIGFTLNEKNVSSEVPFFWSVSGLKSIVRLQPSITGNEPYVETVDQAKILTDLIITGQAKSLEDAQNERNETKILLQSGSLPVAIESITKETISPFLGENFLFLAGIIGVLVLIAVSIIIVLRYKKIKLSIAIIFTSLVEAFCALAFTSLFGNIDLSAIAGVLLVVGTGVNDQIVITDEMFAQEKEVELSFVARIKRAFFMIFAAAATVMATMLPIIIFGSAMIKLFGFAIATIVGVLVGILITRPAYAEIAQKLV